MGRTLPSAAILFLFEEQRLSTFRKLLPATDRLALDQLLDGAHKHVAEAAYTAHPFPMEIFLLAMLLEEHKAVLHLRERIERIKGGKVK